jgi:hypothetical protein
MSPTALSDLEKMKADSEQAAFRDAYLQRLVEILVTVMLNGTYSAQRLNRFAAPLGSREIGLIVSRARRRFTDA